MRVMDVGGGGREHAIIRKLKERYGNAILPDVQTIDTTYQSDMVLENISHQLADEIRENYNNKKQTILLLNRRGYNTYASCTECKPRFWRKTDS